MNVRGEKREAPCPVGFATRGARTRTWLYVEHAKARKPRRVRCIALCSRRLMNTPGYANADATTSATSRISIEISDSKLGSFIAQRKWI